MNDCVKRFLPNDEESNADPATQNLHFLCEVCQLQPCTFKNQFALINSTSKT